MQKRRTRGTKAVSSCFLTSVVVGTGPQTDAPQTLEGVQNAENNHDDVFGDRRIARGRRLRTTD
jgi:hypothetical protein